MAKTQRCLSRKCGICSFDLHDSEQVSLGPTWTVKYTYNHAEPLNDVGCSYYPCKKACTHGSGFNVGCHSECLRILSRAPGRVLEITHRSYEADASERERWLKTSLAFNLSLAHYTPREIRLEIASYLTSVYAAAMVRSLKICRHTSSTINIFAPVKQHFKHFEGKEYLSHMENKPQGEWKTPSYIFIAENACGIIRLLMTGKDVPQIKATAGVWWKAFAAPKSGTLTLRNDGYKIRTLEYDGFSTRELKSWPIPRLSDLDQFYEWRTFQDSQPRLMQAVDYNQPTMIGISVCCNPTPLSFYVHTRDGDLPPYSSGPDSSTWTYVPLAKGELINAIWMRCRRYMDREAALVLETTRKRCIFLGAQAIRCPEPLQWRHVATPRGKPASFYFDLHQLGARELVFKGPVVARPRPTISPSPLSPYPKSTQFEAFMWSSAALDGVISLRQCHRQRSHSLNMVSGLELQYEDGSMTTVGEVRLDSLGDQTNISSSCVWLGFLATHEGYPYITAIEAAHPTQNEVTWFQVPLTGRLEWWYSSQQCQVWHEGRASMPIM